MEGKKRIVLFLSAIFLVGLACSFSGTVDVNEAPTVVIALPAESDTFSVGQVVNVVATVTSEVGVQKVELLVNGQLVSTQEVSGAPTSHSLNIEWTPAAEGAVVLGVIGYDTDGNDSEPALVTIQITGGGGGPPPTQAADPTTEEPAQQTVMCTPPPCGANEAYFCPGGSCPGGCGITCATFTPTNPPPATPTFTSPPPTNTFTPSPTNTSVWVVPSIQIVVSLQVFNLATVETVSYQTTLSPGATSNVSVACPANTVVVSGGYATNPDVFIYHNHRAGNGWGIYGKNNSGFERTMTVYARCLKNTSGTTQEVMAQGTISGSTHDNISISCPAGSIVTGGGFITAQNGNTNIYNSSKSGNGWQVWGDNTGGSGQTVKVYAECLSGVNATTSESHQSQNIPAHGTAGGKVTCPDNKLAVGGGFAAQFEYYLYNASPYTTAISDWYAYAKNPTGEDNIIFKYVICLDWN